ncbi:MAG: hypothetical protein GF411_16310 [Candidatus Lokiarchaeota archaeon]|nr:hypothetical protein [Candidatus Lokiarchaeota archaeon]
MVSISKWLMKQYWRMGQIRTLLSLALGMMVLGRWYYGYIPIIQDWGVFGAIFLGSILILLFMGIGWYYDVKAVMWSYSIRAKILRNPYSYIPNFRSKAIEYPIFYILIKTLIQFQKKLGIKNSSLTQLPNYFITYFNRGIQKSDLLDSHSASKEYMKEHPFIKEEIEDMPKIGLIGRAKGAFEDNMLRLTWIQALTGLFQDIMVLGAFYLTLIFPTLVVDNRLPFFLLITGVALISIPIVSVVAIAGWYYDKKLSVWRSDIAVQVERNPYTYLPAPKEYTMYIPFFYAILQFYIELCDKLDCDKSDLEKTVEYLREYTELNISTNQNMQKAKSNSREFGTLFETV